jgi:hypothetical protein
MQTPSDPGNLAKDQRQTLISLRGWSHEPMSGIQQSWGRGFRTERLLPDPKLPIGATSVKAAPASKPSSQP